MGAAASSEIPLSQLDVDTYTGVRYAETVEGSEEPNRSPIFKYRDLEVADEDMTLYENFLHGVSLSKGAKAMYGTRKQLPDGTLGEYEWITYGQVKSRVDALASGMERTCGLQRTNMVGVIAKNRLEWCLTMHACDRMTYTLVPLYDTLGPDAIPYIVNHTEMRVLLCAAENLHTVLQCVDECPTLQTIVQFEEASVEQRRAVEAKGLRLLTLREVEDEGRYHPTAPNPPTPDDIATVCYTSGTTGNPKGVVLTHRNMTTSAVAVVERIVTEPDEVHMSYLPLPHVFERLTLNSLVRISGSIGFFGGDTMTLMDDMQVLKPTIFISVPRLFNRVYDKMMQGVNAAGGLKKALFDRALASKKAGLVDGHKDHAFWDALVFSKLRQTLGGRVRLIVSGSAPLSLEVKEFLQVVFGGSILEGYGMSENCAACVCPIPSMPFGDHLGPPLVGMELRLESVPEMNYLVTDRPRPRGELLCRAPYVFSGYYKEPDKTKEVMCGDGWIRTGDIACWNANGTLSIIDRRKNIFKLSQGEYVAAEKVEGVYQKSQYIAQLFIYGDSFQSFLVGIVVPDPEVAEAWAQQQGLPPAQRSVKQLIQNEDFKKVVLDDMKRLGKEAELRGFEVAKKVHFHSDLFTLEQDLITPTFKLKRPQLKAFFQKEIDGMYQAKN